MQRHKFDGVRVGIPRVGLVVLGLGLAAVGCSDGDDGVASATTAPATSAVATSSAPETTPATNAPANPDALRGVKYCEVLLLHLEETGIVAEVWNSMGHSVCPADEWAALDAAALAEENEALVALLNGPRYWTLDRIEATMQIDAPVKTFGTIEMFLAATVSLGAKLPDRTPYTTAEVARDTVFVFDAGTEIYELTDPDGVHYVMQSYSQMIDPTMDASRLASLGDILALPEGWTFDVITLDDRLDVYDTDGIAVVVQDEFQNTYQRIDTPPV